MPGHHHLPQPNNLPTHGTAVDPNLGDINCVPLAVRHQPDLFPTAPEHLNMKNLYYLHDLPTWLP